MMTFDEFKKAEIKIGTILSAEKVPDADKLIRLMIDLGPKALELQAEELTAAVEPEGRTEDAADIEVVAIAQPEEQRDIRQILSGIAEYYPDINVLVGRQVPVLANLPFRTIRGLESQGMVLYAVGEGFLTTIGPDHEIPAGTPVR